LTRGKKIIGTHTAPDLDAIASIWLLQKYGNKEEREAVLIFLKSGDEAILTDLGITFLDRGRGELDHHGRRFNSGETSASLVAKKLDLAEEKPIQKLLRKVQRSDLEGESLPFDISDFIKCAQRNKDLSDEERVRLGLRILTAAMEFQMQKLQRDHPWIQAVIVEFLKTKEEKPAAFEEYIQKLSNPKFERSFDLVEITVGEKARSGEEEAIKFARELLELKYKDYVESFQRALAEVDKAWKKLVRGNLIVADVSDEPVFNRAARYRGAIVIVQRNTTGHTQWFFDTEKVDDSLTDSIASMVRLEECLIQGREIPDVDLRRPGRIEKIPEWYYYKAPKIGRKKPGRFLLNGSLTATEEIPVTKIPLENLRYIAESALRYWGGFNWVRWKAERLAYYLNKK
jgi:hypothetical protein